MTLTSCVLVHVPWLRSCCGVEVSHHFAVRGAGRVQVLLSLPELESQVEVGLQGRAARARAAGGVVRWLTLRGVKLGEKVAVPVEECAVDARGVGDGGDADADL